jgi:hypothetical protein
VSGLSFFERTNGNPLLTEFGHCPLIFGGTPKNSVFLGSFLEQDRYCDEIQEYNGDMWASCMTHVKYSCCRRLTAVSEEYSFDLE